jgi:hypothetical protein
MNSLSEFYIAIINQFHGSKILSFTPPFLPLLFGGYDTPPKAKLRLFIISHVQYIHNFVIKTPNKAYELLADSFLPLIFRRPYIVIVTMARRDIPHPNCLPKWPLL